MSSASRIESCGAAKQATALKKQARKISRIILRESRSLTRCESGAISLFFDFAAPRNDARFCACGFRLGDLAIAIVKQRQACPADLIVRPQIDCFFSRFDRFRKTAELPQRHTERMPAVEELRVEIHAALIFFRGAFELAEREIAIRIVENFVDGFAHVEITAVQSARARLRDVCAATPGMRLRFFGARTTSERAACPSRIPCHRSAAACLNKREARPLQ